VTATTSPTRFIPPLANVLANTTNQQQRLPQVARTWNWRATVRDNRANGGGINQADIVLTVNGASGPFTVTAPSGATSWSAGSLRTITWNVANTNVAPVNCANVAIEMSTDGGNTFPITIASSVPNTGSANVTIPNNQTTNGRIRVRAVGNVFYNISQGTLTVTAPVSGVVLTGTGANTLTDSTGNGNNNSRIDPGETGIRLTIPVINTGTTNATSVQATLTSSTPTVSIVTGTGTYGTIASGGGTASNALPYVISVSPSHVCGAPINLSLAITSTQGTGTYAFSLPTGLAGGTSSPTTFTYTGAVVVIPDNNTAGANATITVSGLTGTIADVDFAILGTTCSTAIGATTVGLDHTYVGDLRGTLTSPASTPVVLFTSPGGTGNSGNNFCNTVFDDGASSPIQSIAAAGNPFSGSFTPQNPLSAFNGQNPNGTWTFIVADLAAVDTGNIRSFSLTIRTVTPATCTPSNNNVCPTFSQQPSNAARCVGDSVSFSVVASGTPAPTYQWRLNGNPISTIANPSAATPTLTIASIVPADAGSYTCFISNVCGNLTSNPAVLSLGGPTCSPCDDIDFNNDGLFPDDADLIDFLNVLAGASCSTDPSPGCNDIDFNNDGLFPDDADLLAFLGVLAGQDCTP
jgi:subtilisin-like proprotein convertase family protein